jgi:hypothetical protein
MLQDNNIQTEVLQGIYKSLYTRRLSEGYMQSISNI